MSSRKKNMNSDQRKYWTDVFGKKVPDHEAMASKLLDDGVLFISDGISKYDYLCKEHPNTDAFVEKSPKTITLMVLCNDVFAWGCADAEEVTSEELPVLFEMYQADRVNGPVKWVCKKRNQKPQKPVADMLKEEKSWDDSMESLPDNEYDKMLAEQRS